MAEAAPARISTWAAASLLCSITVCCPVVPVLGVLFGIRALVEIRANPAISGRGLAKSGIAIGIGVCALWIAGLIWWHFNARQPMMSGPAHELRAGMNGDIAAFQSGFTAQGQSATDQEARSFITELRNRYGEFRDSRLSATPQSQVTLAGKPSLRITYTLHFDRGLVEAEAAFVTFGETQSIVPHLVFEWDWVRIMDPARGDLVYPHALAAEAAAPTQSQTQTQPATQTNS